jgi:dUTP pyrophosphatase
MKVKVVNHSDNSLPAYETIHASGMDLRAHLDAPVTIGPMERRLIPTGLFIELPEGYEAQVRPRSGLAVKHGITVLNSPGTIDADYRGEICVILINLSQQPFIVNKGDRIAQLVVAGFKRAEWELCGKLNVSGRGEGGFGHTGKE